MRVSILFKKRLHDVTNEEFTIPVIGYQMRWHLVSREKVYSVKKRFHGLRVMSRHGATKILPLHTIVYVVGTYNPFKEGTDGKV